MDGTFATVETKCVLLLKGYPSDTFDLVVSVCEHECGGVNVTLASIEGWWPSGLSDDPDKACLVAYTFSSCKDPTAIDH